MLQRASVWVAWPPGERGLTFSSSYTSWVPAAECCRSCARKPQHDYLWLPHARIAENKHLHKQLYNVSARQMQQRKGCWGSDFLQGPTVFGLLQVVALANLLPPDSNTDELDSYMYQTVSSVQQALLMALRPVILQCACCHCTACICKQACLISLHMHACMHARVRAVTSCFSTHVPHTVLLNCRLACCRWATSWLLPTQHARACPCTGAESMAQALRR